MFYIILHPFFFDLSFSLAVWLTNKMLSGPSNKCSESAPLWGTCVVVELERVTSCGSNLSPGPSSFTLIAHWWQVENSSSFQAAAQFIGNKFACTIMWLICSQLDLLLCSVVVMIEVMVRQWAALWWSDSGEHCPLQQLFKNEEWLAKLGLHIQFSSKDECYSLSSPADMARKDFSLDLWTT